MSETNIQEREIRGINLRIIISVVVGTIAICSTIVGTYYALKKDIWELRFAKDNDKLIFDMKIQLLQTDINLLKSKQAEFDARLERFSEKK